MDQDQTLLVVNSGWHRQEGVGERKGDQTARGAPRRSEAECTTDLQGEHRSGTHRNTTRAPVPVPVPHAGAREYESVPAAPGCSRLLTAHVADYDVGLPPDTTL